MLATVILVLWVLGAVGTTFAMRWFGRQINDGPTQSPMPFEGYVFAAVAWWLPWLLLAVGLLILGVMKLWELVTGKEVL